MTAHHRHHAEPVEVGFSLLQTSAARRLAIVFILLAALWGAVLWAMA